MEPKFHDVFQVQVVTLAGKMVPGWWFWIFFFYHPPPKKVGRLGG